MLLERQTIKETEHPVRMSWQLVERWADSIPVFSENNPDLPEWVSTSTFPIDLSKEGYGIVYIKDESDKRSNPTGTIKDRPAWELTALFRDFARGLYLQRKMGLVNGNIGQIIAPRFTYVTAGNMGASISESFRRYDLPPMKLLVDSSVDRNRLEKLKSLHADIYMADLSKKPLTADDIKRLTNNEDGIDITSLVVIEPQAIFYDWHVHEAFNEEPDMVFIPYGSGRIMENYLTHQARNARAKDPRLKISRGKLMGISILGAKPEKQDSIADKLAVCHNPFVIFDDHDISSLKALAFTGKDTGIYGFGEQYLQEAHIIMNRHCDAEPSACAGLALYLQMFDKNKISPSQKVLIVNTGNGL